MAFRRLLRCDEDLGFGDDLLVGDAAGDEDAAVEQGGGGVGEAGVLEGGVEQVPAAGDWLELLDAGEGFYAVIAAADGVDVAVGQEIRGEVDAGHDQRMGQGPDIRGWVEGLADPGDAAVAYLADEAACGEHATVREAQLFVLLAAAVDPARLTPSAGGGIVGLAVEAFGPRDAEIPPGEEDAAVLQAGHLIGKAADDQVAGVGPLADGGIKDLAVSVLLGGAAGDEDLAVGEEGELRRLARDEHRAGLEPLSGGGVVNFG